MEEKEKNIKDKATELLNDVKDDSNKFSKSEIESGKLMAILSYIGILVLIPFFAEKNNKFVIYHAKQGMNLFILEVICGVALGILASLLWRLWFIVGLIELVYGVFAFALSIIGIVNVCSDKAKELPVINKIKFVK